MLKKKIKIRKLGVELARHSILILLGVLTFAPFLIMINLSFKNEHQFMLERWTIPFPPYLKGYLAAWNVIWHYLLNSTIISSVSCLIVIALSCVTAYVLARLKFPGRAFFYYAIITLLMIPPTVILIPQFILILQLGLLNTWWGLWGPFACYGQVFTIFILRTFFASLPEELFEAARIDGAGEVGSMWHIAIPIAKPIIATLALLHLLTTWSNFVWPLMVITDDKLKPITTGIFSFYKQYYTQWDLVFSGYVIASLPLVVLFIFASGLFIKGLTSGAVKF